MPRGRGSGNPNKITKEKLANAAKISDADIQEIFDYWVQVMGKRRVALDLARKRNIGNAIFLYGMDACKDAIDGCKVSDFHMGRNKQNKKYNDIELILRDVEHVERFISYLQDE